MSEEPAELRVPPPAEGHSGYFSRMLRFAGAGLVGTGGHYLVLVAGVSLLGQDPVYASVAGALIGALINYLLNYYLNYRSERKHREAGPRFFTVAGSGFALNWWLMAQLVHRLAFPYLMAQIAVTGVVFFWNFTVNHFWTFRQHKGSGSR
jgi:putative flippase GtrA